MTKTICYRKMNWTNCKFDKQKKRNANAHLIIWNAKNHLCARLIVSQFVRTFYFLSQIEIEKSKFSLSHDNKIFIFCTWCVIYFHIKISMSRFYRNQRNNVIYRVISKKISDESLIKRSKFEHHEKNAKFEQLNYDWSNERDSIFVIIFFSS